MRTIRFCSPFFVFLLLVSCDETALVSRSDKAKRMKAWEFSESANRAISQGNPEKAFGDYGRSREISEEANDSAMYVFASLKMAALYHDINDYAGVESASTDARRFISEADTSQRSRDNRQVIYNNYGIAYRRLLNYDKALESYQLALAQTRDSVGKMAIRNNIANMWIDAGKPEKAHAELLALSQSGLLEKDAELKAKILDNLGFSAFKSKKKDDLGPMLQAYAMRRQLRDTTGLITSYMHLAERLVFEDRILAISYARKAEALARVENAVEDRIEALHFLTTHASEMEGGKFGKMYGYVFDSVNRIRQQRKNAFASIRYDFRRERDKRIAYELKAVRAENRSLIWTIVAIVAGVSIVGVYFYYRRKARSERRKAAYETEKRIAGRLHDELANDVHQTILFVENRDVNQASEKEKLLNDLESIYRRTRNISHDNAAIDLGAFQAELSELIRRYQSGKITLFVTGMDAVNWEKCRRKPKYKVIESCRKCW